MKLKRTLSLVLVLLISFACASVAQARPRYAITVDITNQIVTVYRYGSFEEDAIVRQMICSTGYGTTTPKGNFVMPETKYPAEREEWYYFGKFECYAKYASRIDGPILFHSILFGSTHSGPTYASVSALGEKASHGCVRLRVPDSKWIAENCLPGTQVRIFESEGPRNEELRELLKNSSFYCEELSYDEFKEGRVLISYGSKLPQVKEIQDKLNKLGFKCGQVDGYFGERTADAVEAWEESMGYEPNGMLVPDEYDALMAAKIPEPTPTPSPTPVPTPSPTPDISKIEGTVALANAQPYLNMRANPDVKSGVITRLYEGMPVQVLEKGLVWSKVKYEDTVGWVGSDYIKIVREADET